MASSKNYEWRLLGEFILAGDRGIMDLAKDGALAVSECAKNLRLPKTRLERLVTAVKEAVNNLDRRTPPNQPPLPFAFRVYVTENRSAAGEQETTARSETLTEEAPDVVLNAGNGWGFFLVEKMAGAANMMGGIEKFNHPVPLPEPPYHAIEVFLYQEGESAYRIAPE